MNEIAARELGKHTMCAVPSWGSVCARLAVSVCYLRHNVTKVTL